MHPMRLGTDDSTEKHCATTQGRTTARCGVEWITPQTSESRSCNSSCCDPLRCFFSATRLEPKNLNLLHNHYFILSAYSLLPPTSSSPEVLSHHPFSCAHVFVVESIVVESYSMVVSSFSYPDMHTVVLFEPTSPD